jgi:hypothetical protein
MRVSNHVLTSPCHAHRGQAKTHNMSIRLPCHAIRLPHAQTHVYAFCHRVRPASQASRSREVTTSASSRLPAIADSLCSPL